MVSVKASDTAPRVAPNSACTTGMATTTDHMPTLPTEPIASASASRTQASRESGTKWAESWGAEETCTGASSARHPARSSNIGAILGMRNAPQYGPR